MTRLNDIDVLARTIYGEARGESISGQGAIASVVLNRVAFSKRRGRYWWGIALQMFVRHLGSFRVGIKTTRIIKN